MQLSQETNPTTVLGTKVNCLRSTFRVENLVFGVYKNSWRLREVHMID